MSSNFEQAQQTDQVNYGLEYRPEKDVYVIKKDGSKEAFNVQKVINAVGKSAYRALTKFSEEEKRCICQHVIDRINEFDNTEIPIAIMHTSRTSSE